MSSVGPRDLEPEAPELPDLPVAIRKQIMNRQQYLARRMLKIFAPTHNGVISRLIHEGKLTIEKAWDKFRHQNE
jgi:hypothetical protein